MKRTDSPSLKAADRIPGLRQKIRPSRGAPPPWVDWVHKFGPLLTALVTATVFFGTLKYTLEPIYRRALLEEANSRLQLDLNSASQQLQSTLKQSDKAVQLLSAQRAEAESAKADLLAYVAELRAARSRILLAEKQVLDAKKRSSNAQMELTGLQAQFSSASSALVTASRRLESVNTQLTAARVQRIIDDSYSSQCYWAILSTANLGVGSRTGRDSLSTKSFVNLDDKADSKIHPITKFDHCVSSAFVQQAPGRTSSIDNDVLVRLMPVMLHIDAAYSSQYRELRDRILSILREARTDRQRADEEMRLLQSPDVFSFLEISRQSGIRVNVLSDQLQVEIARAQDTLNAAHEEFVQAARALQVAR